MIKSAKPDKAVATTKAALMPAKVAWTGAPEVRRLLVTMVMTVTMMAVPMEPATCLPVLLMALPWAMRS